jgi:hypothetical protein
MRRTVTAFRSALEVLERLLNNRIQSRPILDFGRVHHRAATDCRQSQ